MPTAKWTFISNTFEVQTRGSYSRAGKIARYTADQLIAMARTSHRISELQDYFIPLNTAYQRAMAEWLAAGGTREGATLSLTQLEEAINTDVNSWEQSVKNTFMPGTPGYVAIFPHGITDLKRGKRQDKIEKLTALSLNLDADTALAPVKAQVDARIAQLEALATDQGGKKGLTKTNSEAVEENRIAVCTGLYSVLGSLMALYAATPDRIAPFFDLTTLRDAAQHYFTGPVAAGATRNIAQRSLAATDMVTLTNNGTANITFYFASAATAATGPANAGVRLAPGEATTVAAAALGNVPADAFLMVMNTGDTAGHWTAEL